MCSLDILPSPAVLTFPHGNLRGPPSPMPRFRQETKGLGLLTTTIPFFRPYIPMIPTVDGWNPAPRLDVWNPEENGCRKKCTVYLSYWTGDRRISKKTSTVSWKSQGASPKCQVYPPFKKTQALLKGMIFLGPWWLINALSKALLSGMRGLDPYDDRCCWWWTIPPVHWDLPSAPLQNVVPKPQPNQTEQYIP